MIDRVWQSEGEGSIKDDLGLFLANAWTIEPFTEKNAVEQLWLGKELVRDDDSVLEMLSLKCLWIN